MRAVPLRERLRPLYAPVVQNSPTLRVLYLLARPPTDRVTKFVEDGYDTEWASYGAHLETASSLDDWLYLRGVDDVRQAYAIDGRVTVTSFDSNKFHVETIAEAVRSYFPNARRFAEYGCGVGRNVLRLKRMFPDAECFGYELSQEGVDIANAAAKKFGVDAKYARLDYVKGKPEDFVFGDVDVAFTIFSLEQVPYTNLIGAKNMLDHARLGSIHLEPVSENYPLTYRGVLGRIYAQRVNYLKNFDGGVRAIGLRNVRKRVIDTAHNPLMYPTLYVLEKEQQ